MVPESPDGTTRFSTSRPVRGPAVPWLAALLLLSWGCGGEGVEGDPPEAGDAESAHVDHPEGESPEFGRVSLPVSCDEGVTELFEEGVALLHSFYFNRAREAFEAVAAEDPDCAMAHWGLALTHRGNPFAGPAGPDGDRRGLEAAERALALGPPTAREAGYVEAVLALFRDHDQVDYRTRGLRYEEVMDRVRREHPEDDEATIFYAREVVANASPADRTFERQLRATELMEPLFEEQPRHPGLAHYIIHAYDVPQLAHRGLEAARAYAEIAPSAPHALHMPSHIFTRLGHWDESIETNRRSAEVDDPDSGHRLHAWDYKVYGFLQQGRDDEAARVLADAEALAERLGGDLSYNGAAMPARYALERDRWSHARDLPVRSASDSPAEAVTRFARGIGAARSGDLSRASEEVAALARIRDALGAAGEDDWAERTEAQRLAVSAWIAFARGEEADARAMADEAGTIEERVEKHPVTPGPLLPARELHGDLLLAMERPGEALEAYRATLEREPNRARTLAGAARAAEEAGEDGLAREYYDTLARLMADADPERPELARAREYLDAP